MEVGDWSNANTLVEVILKAYIAAEARLATSKKNNTATSVGREKCIPVAVQMDTRAQEDKKSQHPHIGYITMIVPGN